jgi:sulfoquinovosidase
MNLVRETADSHLHLITVRAQSVWVVALMLFALPAVPLRASVSGNRGAHHKVSSTLAYGGPYTVGNFLIRITATGGQPALNVVHKAEPTRLLWQSVPESPFLGAAQGSAAIREVGVPEGGFDIKDNILKQCDQQKLATVKMDGATLVLAGTLSGSGCTANYRLTFAPVSANQLQFKLQFDGPGARDLNRLFLRYGSSADERFFGFGQQLTYFDQKGNVVPVLVQEHGVGRGLPIVTEVVNQTQNEGGGNPYITEAPAPQYITTKVRSLFLENKEYSIFDLRYADRVEVELFANTMTGRILYGKTPLALIEEYTCYAGRMRVLPDWIHQGVIVGMQGGTAKVQQQLAELDRAGVPIAALWIQDWVGRRVTSVGSQLWWDWHLDESFYPGWSDLVATLKQRNARMLIYISTFLSNTMGHDALFREAEKAGYLVKQADGKPYLIRNTDFYAGMVDLSNPEACEWFKSVIKAELIARAGASGWMADFGEALPFDSVLSGGANPAEWHNHYTEKWGQINREAIQEAGRTDDIVFFNRSGFTQSPGQSTLFWLGDQLQTWDEFDGIKTAVVGLLSGGVSGFSLLHSDTGGFNALGFRLADREIPLIARSKELEMRWEELSAFNCVFRTHEGLNPAISAQYDTDAETLAHFARMAKVYKALAFYRKQLVEEAARSGYPVVRHPFLEYPDDPNTYQLRFQFMYGTELMVAPVLDPGVTSVRAYLPKGDWTNLWSGESLGLAVGEWVEVAAPIGKPAVFYKKDSAIGQEFVRALKAQGVY